MTNASPAEEAMKLKERPRPLVVELTKGERDIAVCAIHFWLTAGWHNAVRRAAIRKVQRRLTTARHAPKVEADHYADGRPPR